jgi:hypothetical protein
MSMSSSLQLMPTTTAFHEAGLTYLALASSEERLRRPSTTNWLTTRQTTQIALGTYKTPALLEYAYRQIVTKHRTLDVNGIKTACPLDNGKHSTKAQTYDLGVLEERADFAFKRMVADSGDASVWLFVLDASRPADGCLCCSQTLPRMILSRCNTRALPTRRIRSPWTTPG